MHNAAMKMDVHDAAEEHERVRMQPWHKKMCTSPRLQRTTLLEKHDIRCAIPLYGECSLTLLLGVLPRCLLIVTLYYCMHQQKRGMIVCLKRNEE